MPDEECDEHRNDDDCQNCDSRGTSAVTVDDYWISLSHKSGLPGAGGDETLMWNVVGLALALLVAVIAWWRSKSRGSFYDADVYRMTATHHRRYALVSLAFALFFGIAYLLGAQAAGTILLAPYALIVIFYSTSFLRGAYEDDE